MKSPPPSSGPVRAASAPRAFTLVEILVAMTVGMLVMAAVASILVMSLRMVNKNQEIDAAVANTRMVQEHLNSELAKAISQNTPFQNRPVFSNFSSGTPQRAATLIYRVPIGSYGTVVSDTPNTQSTLTVSFPADVTPQVGDYVIMDTPSLIGQSPVVAPATQPGIRVTGVSGSSPGTVTLTLATTLAAGTDPSDTTTVAGNGKLVRIQREREYESVTGTPTGTLTTQLRWYESTIDVGATPPKYTVLSDHVDANSPYLFAQIPLDTGVPAPEPSVSWQFSYVATGTGALAQGGLKSFYQTNYAEGLIFPKSGNPLSAASYLGAGPSTLGTSTTNVSSTTTLGTSTTNVSSTTTKGTSTTKVSSTTTSGTSTTNKSTTTSGTSTTNKTSSTNKSTTTSGTSTTNLTSTTNKSTTTSGTTSTNKTSSTNKSTTTSGTSTTNLTSTTLKSTTTSGTSTTNKSSTTTSGTSTTLKSTTTSGTSTTNQSTTTSGTSTTNKSSTTTTTIPFDG